MSRSYHTTRRELEEELRWEGSDEPAREERLARLRRQLAQKRWTKDHVRRLRETQRARRPLAEPPSELAIELREEHPAARYPADLQDLRAVLARLPAGALEGVTGVEVLLGKHEQEEGDPDPITGRRSFEVWPGLHVPLILGTYSGSTGRIRLYAFVFEREPELHLRAYLRLLGLSTLVHEVAHNEDVLLRRGEEAWASDPDKWEAFAREQEHRWAREIVLPYLREAHAEEVRALEDWALAHGGCRLTLEDLKPADWRADHRLWTVGGALQELVQGLLSGEDRLETRCWFAWNLRAAERPDLAREALERTLEQAPEHLPAQVELALALNDLGERAAAHLLLDAVLAQDPDLEEAWRAKVRVHQDEADWTGMESAARAGWTHAAFDAYERQNFGVDRGQALLRLGRLDSLEAHLEELAAQEFMSRAIEFRVATLRAMLYSRTDRHAEALQVAEAALPLTTRSGFPRHALTAVRYEALLALGERHRARPLEAKTLDRLRLHGHEDWVARLEALQPLRGGR